MMPACVSLQHHLCFVEVIEGETDDLKRQVCESNLVDHLSRSGVSPQSIDINGAGCFVTVKVEDLGRLKAIARTFNVAIRVHEHCDRIVLARKPAYTDLPSLADVISALHKQGIKIVNVAADSSEISVLVDSGEVHLALAVMASCCPAGGQQYVA
jgi:aspartokinase